MATEVTQSAYSDFRDKAMAEWNWLELRDGTTTVHTVDITNDWVLDGDVIKVEKIVTGADVGTGVSVDTSAIYDVENGDLKHEEVTTAVTFETSEDELHLTHTIEIPQIV